MFANDDNAHSAVRMNGWMLGGRNVMVEFCSMESYERAVDSYIPPGKMPSDRPPMKRARSRSPKRLDGSLAIVVKNLPFSVVKRDIFQHFNGIRFSKGDLSVCLEYNKDGRPNGNALIELASDRDLHEALKMHRREEMGGRIIDVIHVPWKEYRERVDNAAKYTSKDDKPSAAPIKKTSPPKDKVAPRIKDEKIPSSRVKDEPQESNGKDVKSSRPKPSLDKKEDKIFCVKMHGVPFDVDKPQIQAFFKDLQIANKGIRIVYLPNGRASHTCFVEFVTSEDCKKALAKDKEYIGQRYINISPVTKQQLMDEFHRMTKVAPPGSSSVANQVGKPGCVVGIQNLHFNATLEDILHFFKGYSPIANSVKMRYNTHDGRPMGDAMLAFQSRDDAERAVSEMHKRSLMGRPVSLAFM